MAFAFRPGQHAQPGADVGGSSRRFQDDFTVGRDRDVDFISGMPTGLPDQGRRQADSQLLPHLVICKDMVSSLWKGRRMYHPMYHSGSRA
jgi:hypothetical protein